MPRSGGNHIAALQLGFPDSAIVNPAGASPEVVTTKQCNECHILQKKFDEDPENPGWIRSQGVGWTRSRCNTESGGASGCVTCHNPHQKASGRAPQTTRPNASSATPRPASDGEQATVGTRTSACPDIPPVPRQSVERLSWVSHAARTDESLHGELTDHFIRVRGQKR